MALLSANRITGLVLKSMAIAFTRLPHLKQMTRHGDSWLSFAVGIETADRRVSHALSFSKGRCTLLSPMPESVEAALTTRTAGDLKTLATVPPGEAMVMMLRNRVTTRGNLACIQLVNRMVAALAAPLRREGEKHAASLSALHLLPQDPHGETPRQARNESPPLSADASTDPGVLFLEEPYLASFGLDQLPRIKERLDEHLSRRPEICAERAHHLTSWYETHGFETRTDGSPWHPVKRQGQALAHTLEKKSAIIGPGHRLAGTTTSKWPCGVMIYPETHGTSLWSELDTVSKRPLNPYDISKETRNRLAHLFPHWIHRNIREEARKRLAEDPLPLTVDERWVAYFCWKSVGISHTAPDFETLLALGTQGVGERISNRLKKGDLTDDARGTLEGFAEALSGVERYAELLAKIARKEAAEQENAPRREALSNLSDICRKVPFKPATTLHEALQCIWTTWVSLHMENTDTGLSIGRLDQLLQPYFAADLSKCTTDAQREAAIKEALELCCDFFLCLTDHMPMSPDIGNYLFGGSPSDQAITLGGVKPDGTDAVCDMTYILLKVTEMLSLHDPNINARVHTDLNSPTYIKRLAEVNLTTGATPSIHSDKAVLTSLAKHGYPEHHARDWCAIGCVEPTLTGKHSGHTGSILMNLVAAFEMAMHNGLHPLMGIQVGPKTGDVDSFSDFDSFFDAVKAQLTCLIGLATRLNNTYAEIHAEMRPTPLLSCLTQGCIESATDATSGGALYNSSGTSNIGLADITDALMAVKTLVFEREELSLKDLKEALNNDFQNAPELRETIRSRVPLFGSGAPEPLQLANELTGFLSKTYGAIQNHREGPYTTGFWSMSQHVAYGNLSGALPSGRHAGMPFTPGLTPQPHASNNYLDFIRSVAALSPDAMDNNIAFNVKLVPKAGEERREIVNTMAAYVTSYMELGGMQIQFNVVDADTLKDAMRHPENHANLIVRISGYNAYFVRLNPDQQMELIQRAEHTM